ncbi:DUF2269 family protein [Paragemmobacter straminiformis]|uniref:DUF2269 family protein n=1 Tax=Paragemmobacter straminiformis TaxID=2045119 RepID=A0A842I1Z6_9RHOB|nr:DUF2269 family protein [Gemmobacter straminiformis]MBC2834040.1 DUF2269 family protein [Gemmobacter straminiformis]
MTPFDIARALHITTAILWVGGGISLAVGAEVLSRKRGPAAMFSVVELVALLGPGYFVPISMLTLLTGGIAAWTGTGFAQLWIVLGLTGAAVTFLVGLLVIKPRTEEIARLRLENPDHPEIILPRIKSLMAIARFDHLVLLLVIAIMTLKPTPYDRDLLAGLAALLLLGVAATVRHLRPVRRAAPV